MSTVRITVALMDDDDLALLGDAVISQTGAIAVAELDDAKLPALMDRGLCLLTVERKPRDTPASRVQERNLAPALRQRRPATDDRPIGEPRLSFDVRRPWLKGAGGSLLGRRGGPGSDIRVVAFDRYIGGRDLEDLIENGCQPLERLGPLTTTVRVNTAEAVLTDLPQVVAKRRYDARDTINPDLLRTDLEPRHVVAEAFLHPWGQAEPDSRAEVLAELLTESGATVLGSSTTKVRFEARRGDPMFVDLASLPEVRWVDEYVQPTLANDHARRIVGLEPAAAERHSRPSATPQVPWTGAGQVVGMADSGIDQQHPDFDGQIQSVLIATPHAQGTDTAGHGTHIAGSIAGNGSTVRGMAPQSRLVVQSLLQANGSIDVPLDLGQLFDQAKSAGAQIHNNSWSIKAARPSSSRSQNTTVTSPSTAASVIVTPNSTVRTIVSATTAAADDVGSDTGLPGR